MTFIRNKEQVLYQDTSKKMLKIMATSWVASCQLSALRLTNCTHAVHAINEPSTFIQEWLVLGGPLEGGVEQVEAVEPLDR